MLRYITMGQARERIIEGYCYQYVGAENDIFYQNSINKIAEWSDDVEISIYSTPGFFYFENKEDLLNFRLRWC